ncbi:uncharacterized protein B0P05DRAFT_545383 [Gilbertella persicaria]|uniref:uncharacterized protein n=1 Tax=Gilbertella persicaria TaxID=101096 RepID=UPI002220F39C|nr:uncharacterized protein B0P05DRAFT_545383 [Gilbertella persicaria]KAI8076664.1 hypothetical protein B0P05DRAFT_545383 [Gilbertella persicaria]
MEGADLFFAFHCIAPIFITNVSLVIFIKKVCTHLTKVKKRIYRPLKKKFRLKG